MTPKQIKEELSMIGIYMPEIAKEFNCSPQNIHQIISNTPTKEGKPSLVREYIAKLLNKKYNEVWE
jgi:predicted DNA-binding protein YlxM (UPF0122 family)